MNEGHLVVKSVCVNAFIDEAPFKLNLGPVDFAAKSDAGAVGTW